MKFFEKSFHIVMVNKANVKIYLRKPMDTTQSINKIAIIFDIVVHYRQLKLYDLQKPGANQIFYTA